MKAGTWNARTSLFFVVSLLVLAGAFSDAHLAWGQAKVGCARSEGIDEVPPPSITAAQVEADPTEAKLMTFVLAARDYLQDSNPQEQAYASCVFRRDEGDWKSGSVYIVALTGDGTVTFHSKDMAFTGRQLHEDALLPIAAAAGLDPATQSFTDPDGGALDMPFSGYVVGIQYSNVSVLLTAGLEIQESHLKPVVLDPADTPAVTASDVTDRESLKSFVNGAIEFVSNLFASEGTSAVTRMKSVFRQEEGPWREGSIYLYVLDATGYVWFHGAFPQQYEFVVATGRYTDAVTGEPILFKIIEAAQENPEGAFIEYHFDDPADDSDSAENPKVAYVRQHSLVPGLEDLFPPVIFGAGFYKGNQMALDFAHFANGESFSSDVVVLNLATTPIQPLVYFYGKDGELIDPGSMVNIMGNLTTTDFGALTLQSELPSQGEITVSTNGMGDLMTGSVKVVTEGPDSPVGGVLRFDAPGIGVAGVGASLPVRDAIIPVRRQTGGINTGAALRNLSESELTLTCLLMMDGETIETQPVTLPANGQTAMFISELFQHDTSEFTGSMRCTAPAGVQEFTGVAVELDATNGIFTTLPVIPLIRDASSDEEITPEQ